MFEIIVEKEGLEFLGWRDGSGASRGPGPEGAGHVCPASARALSSSPEGRAAGAWTLTGSSMWRAGSLSSTNDNTYVASLSSRTIVYKGMFLVEQLRTFYPDLQRRGLRVRHRPGALPLLHQHQSQLGAGPSQPLHRPQRRDQHHPGQCGPVCWPGRRPCPPGMLDEDMDKVLPVVNATGSDSAMLDNTLEFLVMSGHGPASGRDGRHPGALEHNDAPFPATSGISTSITPP